MIDFLYTPDQEQKVHSAGAIALICKPFQSHDSGLPEWAKNAADAYARENASSERRVIVLVFCDRKSLGPPSIACLDFVGSTSSQIENFFRHWASPDAAAQDAGARVQGGHGNGGKCYMTQMFADHAVFHTVRDGKGCRYGVKGGSSQFGYVPTPAKGRDFKVANHRKELDALLQQSALSFDDLPDMAKRAFALGSGFSLVKGVGPKHHDEKIRVKDLVTQIRDHAQMLVTLQFCSVFVIYNGRLLPKCGPLKPSQVDPIPGAEEPRIVAIPATLEDPTDGEIVSTTDGGKCAEGTLTLRTSNVSMKWKKKSLHTINYRASSGFIGYKGMMDFPVQSAYRDKLFGECVLESLEPFKQNDRSRLADVPLTRAVDYFIAEQIEEYAQEFETQDKKRYTQKERNALSQMNEALDRWKNRFLRNFVEGAFGPGGGPVRPGPLPSGKPARIEIAVSHPHLGLGVAIRPIIRFYDAKGRQVRSVPFRWVSDDPNVAVVLEDLMVINSFSPGNTIIYAETLDDSLESNRVPIEVTRIRSIRIEPQEAEVAVGSRTTLRAVCSLSSGIEVDDVALIWTEGDGSIARVSAYGVVFGASAGVTDISVGDDKVSADRPAIVRVVEGDGEGSGRAGKKGKGKGAGTERGQGFPLILVSGEVDRDPDSGEFVYLSAEHPPVYQSPRDADRNIWWINSASPLARMYLDKTLGFGYDSREWRMYHLERYISIITEIAMKYDPQIEGGMTVNEFYLYVAERSSEIQAAIAEDLTGFIKDGEAPEV